jgi:16S rRNA (adenine1518-N6/adenine1519-N6)-dimethyltransferase
VESALVRITRHGEPPVNVIDPEAMFMLVRAGFATRRKMLRQSLKSVLGADTIAALERAGLDPTARAEELDLEAWAALANAR